MNQPNEPMDEPQNEEKARVSAELKHLLEEGRKVDEEAIAYLRTKGIEPPPKRIAVRSYAAQFGVSVETVNEWIDTGIIPAEDVRVLTEFNNIRFIRPIPYGPLVNESTSSTD